MNHTNLTQVNRTARLADVLVLVEVLGEFVDHQLEHRLADDLVRSAHVADDCRLEE